MISSETGKALKLLASAVKTSTQPPSVNSNVSDSKAAAEVLKSLFKVCVLMEETDLLEIMPSATVASLLSDVITCTEKIAACINELASQARFKNPNIIRENSRLRNRSAVQPISGNEEQQQHHVITITE